MVLRGVELAFVHGAHHFEVSGLRMQIQPLKDQFFRTDRAHGKQVHHRGIRLLQIPDQQGQLVPCWKIGVFLDLIGRKICIRRRV